MRTKMSSIDKFSLDLHGVYHSEVPTLVDRFLYEHMLEGSMMINIITGNSDAMKNIVGKILDEYGFSYKESLLNSGTIMVVVE